VVVGTSGVVYPAAGFALAAKYSGARTVCINLENPHNNDFFDILITGRAGEVLPGLVSQWLENFDHLPTL
jgi:NAD-dependent deacetylase